ETRGERAHLVGFEVEGDVRREGVGAAPELLQLGGYYGADRGDFTGERDVQLPPGLHVILAAQVDFLVADERPLNGDAVHHLFHAREQVHGEIDAGVDLSDLEVFWSGNVVFEVEGVQMANGARDFKEDHIAGAAPRIGLASG